MTAAIKYPHLVLAPDVTDDSAEREANFGKKRPRKRKGEGLSKEENVKVWSKAEDEFVAQFGGSKTPGPAMQNRDIDVMMAPEWNPRGMLFISVKDQVDSSAQYGGITLEMWLENPETGHKRQGNFLYCQAAEYGWKVTLDGKVVWLRMKCEEFKQWVKDNEQRLEYKTTMASTTSANSDQGRKYTKSHILVVPVKMLVEEFKPQVIEAL